MQTITKEYAYLFHMVECARQELSRLRLCVGDGEREERAAEQALPGAERRELP